MEEKRPEVVKQHDVLETALFAAIHDHLKSSGMSEQEHVATTLTALASVSARCIGYIAGSAGRMLDLVKTQNEATRTLAAGFFTEHEKERHKPRPPITIDELPPEALEIMGGLIKSKPGGKGTIVAVDPNTGARVTFKHDEITAKLKEKNDDKKV